MFGGPSVGISVGICGIRVRVGSASERGRGLGEPPRMPREEPGIRPGNQKTR
jgi:hypothetical protein